MVLPGDQEPDESSSVKILYWTGETDREDEPPPTLSGLENPVTVVPVETAAQVTEHLETGPVDCIIARDDPPNTDGLAVLSSIRTTHDVPVVLHTTRTPPLTLADEHAAYIAVETDDAALGKRVQQLLDYPTEPHQTGSTQEMTSSTPDNTPLGRLAETVQTITESDSTGDLYDRIVECGERLAGCDRIVVYEFSEESGVLEPVAGEDIETATPVKHGDGIVWEAFIEGHLARSSLDGGTIVAVPLGAHGVFVATLGRDAPNETSDTIAVLSNTATVVRDRLKSDERIRDHERRVDEQALDLERAATVNTIFSDIGEAIVATSTLDELGKAVCESFATAKPYVFAWLCRYDETTEAMEFISQAGITSDYGEQFTGGEAATNLMGTLATKAATTKQAAVENVLETTEWRTERKDALIHGFNSVVAIPIVAGEQTTHVLFVHVATADSVTERERTAFSKLGRLIGHGLQTVVRSGRQLTDERVEIEVHTADDRLLCNRLSAKLNCRMNIEGILEQIDGQTMAFVSFVGVEAEAVLETATQMENVVELGLISATDNLCLFEMRFSEPALLEILDAHGAMLKEMGTQHGQSHIRIDMHPDASVRDLVSAIKRAYPDTELAARRDHTTPRQTRHTFYALLEAELTEKQFTALKTAYLGGFYEWPRVTNGEELAQTLDISAPTLQYHLRAAERKLVTLALDGKL